MIHRVANPYSGKTVCEIPFDGEDDRESKVAAASSAQRQWSQMPVRERVRRIDTALDHFRGEKAGIAEEITLQMGKPLAEALAEVDTMLGRAEHAIAMAEEVLSPDLPPEKDNLHLRIEHEALGVVLVASCLGYVAYLLSIGRRYRTEFGLLQAVGLSRRQLALLAGFEHLVILLIGMGLGTWAGLRMGALMVSSLVTPGSGPRAVPPVELATNWAQILPVYIAVLLIAGASLVVLNRRALQMDLRDISNLTE